MPDNKPKHNVQKSDNSTIYDTEPQLFDGVPTGMDDMDTSTFRSGNGVRPDSDTAFSANVVPDQPANLTADYGIAVDGGFLSGQKDKFEGDRVDKVRQEPGAGRRANEGLHNNRDQETDVDMSG